MPINIASQAVHSTDSSFKKFFKGFFAWNGKQYTIVKTSDKSITYREEKIKNALPLSIFKVALCFTLVVPLVAFLYQRIDAQKLKDYIFTPADVTTSPTIAKVEAEGARRLSSNLGLTSFISSKEADEIEFSFPSGDKYPTESTSAKLLFNSLNMIPEGIEAFTQFMNNSKEFVIFSSNEAYPASLASGCKFIPFTKAIGLFSNFLIDFQKAYDEAKAENALTDKLKSFLEKVVSEIKVGNKYIAEESLVIKQPDLAPEVQVPRDENQELRLDEKYSFSFQSKEKKLYRLPDRPDSKELDEEEERILAVGNQYLEVFKNLCDHFKNDKEKTLTLKTFADLSEKGVIYEVFSSEGSEWKLVKVDGLVGASLNITDELMSNFEEMMKLIETAVDEATKFTISENYRAVLAKKFPKSDSENQEKVLRKYLENFEKLCIHYQDHEGNTEILTKFIDFSRQAIVVEAFVTKEYKMASVHDKNLMFSRFVIDDFYLKEETTEAFFQGFLKLIAEQVAIGKKTIEPLRTKLAESDRKRGYT